VAMRGNLRVETTSHKRNSGNLFKAFKRMLTGESFFLNHFYSQGEKAELWLSHPLPGDMEVLILNDSTGVIVSGGSFVASSEGIESDLSWQGMKGLFSGENIFWLKMSGQGSLIVNCYGTIYTVDVDGEYIVDTGHVVAFEETLNFEITKAGSSWLHSFLGGEGLVSVPQP
jgi:uncharacterized protein (TIGR00266 family)